MGRKYLASFIVAAIGASLIPLQDAQAACVGGKSIKGNFAATINGPVIDGSTAQVFNGILTANGKCKLNGTLTGGTFGQASLTRSVSGTYSVPADGPATVSLLLPGASTAVVYDVGLITDGQAAEVTGVATNGPAIATIDLTAIAKKRYNLASLTGTYVATCTGAGNSGTGGLGAELVYFTFDGGGNVAALSLSNDNGALFTNPIVNGTYTVGTDGSFTIGYPGDASRFVVDGELINGGTELHAILIDNNAGFGPYRTCVIKTQA
jgi:hypothetical protein